MAAWRYCASNDPLSFAKALNLGAELFNDTNGFMTYGQPFGDRVFTSEDVDVGSADRRGCEPNQRIGRANVRYWLFVQFYPIFLHKNCSFHGSHGSGFLFGIVAFTFA
ncbi:hypothetical protein D3C79_844100 [compost metagenome]